jgi:fatty-acyl-CoA synthase
LRPKSRTLSGLLDELAESYGTKEALFFEDQMLTFAEWKKKSELFANGLYRLGIRKGDRVAVLISNRIEWFVAMFGIAKIGAIGVAVNTWYKADDIEYVLRQSGAKVLVTMDRFLKNNYIAHLQMIVPQINDPSRNQMEADHLPDLKQVVVLGDDVPPAAIAYKELLHQGLGVRNNVLQEQAPLPNDIMYILYTSGSTAIPKGVTLLHGDLIENGYNIGERQHIDEGDRLWLAVPLFFSFASANAILASLTHGAGIVIQENFDAKVSMELIDKHRCTIYYGMPVMTHAISNHPDRQKYNLTSLQKGLTIGPSDVIKKTAELVPNLSNVYGSTETYGNCCVSDGLYDREIRFASQGKPLPGVDLKIVDPDTRISLKPGEVGEVCVRGYITPGYYKDEINTKAAIDKDGYYLSGDVGYVDENGYFYYVGRIKEMIKTGGINVSPLSIQECLLTHPAIKEAHIVGVDDSVKGEVIAAILELKEDRVLSENEVIEYCKEKLPSYSVPRYVQFWKGEEFPLTDTGKMNKRLIKERANSRLGVKG